MGHSDHKFLPSFLAESSLGKLAKWLRLAGFDTIFDSTVPNLKRLLRMAETEGRIVLTRTHSVSRRLTEEQGLFIASDAPLDQIRQVLRHFNLHREDLRLFTRCAICNQVLRPVQKEHLPGSVPDYVRQHYARFLTCGRCRRIYWPGTHSVRASALIDRWFE